jgi:signal transduction histidine kinase
MNSLDSISLNQALELLGRLQVAAPQPTAVKLGQIRALLEHYAEENTFLNTALVEKPASNPVFTTIPDDLMLIDEADANPADKDKPPPDEESAVDLLPENALGLFAGLNDALRPPLVAIRGRAELVQAGFVGQITVEQDNWLQAIHENTGRAFAVLDALQEIIALKKGQVRIDPVTFVATDLLTESWERMRDKARHYDHDITIQAPDIVPLVRGDFYQSLIVMSDLLDNAMRYTTPGGQIKMSVDNLGTHVLFSVVDNGIGLAPEDLEHVGKPFWRGTRHRLVRQHNGTGLRLALAKQVLALQDGELIFSGEPGQGSTFSFTLPLPE